MRQKARHGDGNLTKRGNVWIARWSYGGKSYWRSTGTDDEDEARKRLVEFTADFQRDGEAATLRRQVARLGGVREQIRQAEEARPALALSAMFEKFRKSPRKRHEWSATTAETYASRFAVFRDWFARNRPAVVEARHVSEADADAFMEFVGATRSAKTFNEFRAFLSQMWDALAKETRAKVNPWKGITRKSITRANEHERRPLTMDEAARVLSSVSGEMRLLFALGLYTGLRLGDAATLAWSDVDLSRGFIVTTPAKTVRHGTTARIPIAATLAAMLAETPPKGRRGDVLPELAAEYRRSPRMVSKRVSAVFERAGIVTHSDARGRMKEGVDVGFHSLRHTFISLAGNAGVPLDVVRRIVGHTKSSMTDRYFPESDAALLGVVAALPALSVSETVAEDDGAADAEAVEVEEGPQGGEEARASALRPVGAGNVPQPPSGASGGILGEFSALVARMSDDERAEALRLLRAAMGAAE